MKRTTVVILSVILVCLCTIAGTYSVIIEVTKKDNVTEIVNQIKVKDLFINTNGEYNNLYYDVKRELNITEEEANILMESAYINDSLQVVLDTIVDYKVNNNTNAKLSSDEIYNLIENSVNNTTNISEEVKTRIINKSNYYKNDISKYLYDIDVNILES